MEEKKQTAHSLDEKEIEVKRAMPRGNRDRNASLKTHKIFVGGLDTDVDEETSKYFTHFPIQIGWHLLQSIDNSDGM